MKRFVVFVVMATLSSLMYVYQEIEAVQVGYRIRKQIEEKTQLLDHARNLKYNISRLKAPADLEKKLSDRNIVLGAPQAWQTLVLSKDGTFQRPVPVPQAVQNSSFLGKIFIGTAQAEAKDA